MKYTSRVTGYVQAVSGWNEGEKQEMKDRKSASTGAASSPAPAFICGPLFFIEKLDRIYRVNRMI